jgi:hypothetical protein
MGSESSYIEWMLMLGFASNDPPRNKNAPARGRGTLWGMEVNGIISPARN